MKQFVQAAGGEKEVKVIKRDLNPRHMSAEKLQRRRDAAAWRARRAHLSPLCVGTRPSAQTASARAGFPWSHTTRGCDCNYSLHTKQQQCTQITAESLLRSKRERWRVFLCCYNPTVAQVITLVMLEMRRCEFHFTSLTLLDRSWMISYSVNVILEGVTETHLTLCLQSDAKKKQKMENWNKGEQKQWGFRVWNKVLSFVIALCDITEDQLPLLFAMCTVLCFWASGNPSTLGRKSTVSSPVEPQWGSFSHTGGN